MTEQERLTLLKALADKKKNALENKEAAIKYVHEIGILTKKGNMSSSYKSLCIAEDRD